MKKVEYEIVLKSGDYCTKDGKQIKAYHRAFIERDEAISLVVCGFADFTNGGQLIKQNSLGETIYQISNVTEREVELEKAETPVAETIIDKVEEVPPVPTEDNFVEEVKTDGE